jgi:hypothetical protein
MGMGVWKTDGWVAAGRVVNLLGKWTDRWVRMGRCMRMPATGLSIDNANPVVSCEDVRSPVNPTHFSHLGRESHRANRDLYCAGGRVNKYFFLSPKAKKKLQCEYWIVSLWGYETTKRGSKGFANQFHGDDIQAVTALLPCDDLLSSRAE